MRTSKKTLAVAGLLITAAIAAAVALADSTTDVTGVPSANTRSAGYAPAPILSPELRQIAVAQGSTRVENPSPEIAYYGYDNDLLGPGGQPLMVPTAAVPANEAHKTEPDKNTYLVFDSGLSGLTRRTTTARTSSSRATREGRRASYITRINLDADAAHRVTLLATQDAAGTRSQRSTARRGTRGRSGCCSPPRARTHRRTRPRRTTRRLSRTSRARSAAAATRASRTTLTGTSGSSRTSAARTRPGTVARAPNSFVYRYVPRHPGDLHNGQLEVLQVLHADRTPITQATQSALQSPDQMALHTFGTVFDTRWVTDPRHRRRRQRLLQRERARRS